MGQKFGISSLADGALSLNDRFNAPTEKVVTVKRVKDIILDENHPKFEQMGGWSSIGTIFITDIRTPDGENSKNDVEAYAIPIFPNLRQYPLINEIVLTINLPDSSLESERRSQTSYYFPSINVWNNPHHNAIPSATSLPPSQQKSIQEAQAGSSPQVNNEDTQIELGESFQENGNLHPLRFFEGDNILEGRFGNSIRLGSTNIADSPLNNWSSQPTTGDPIMLLRNGQGEVNTDAWIPITEDITNDKSSIYLTSTQQINLTPSIFNYNSYIPSKAPEEILSYKSPQVILNSGRIVLNSYEDHTLISGIKSVNLNSQDTINLDATNRVAINSKEILLGSKDATEPILLGNKTVSLLQDVFQVMLNVSNALAVLQSLPPGAPFAPLNIQANLASQKLSTALAKLESLKSPNNKTL